MEYVSALDCVYEGKEHILRATNEEIDDHEEDDGVGPVANESSAKAAEYDIYGDADGEEESGGHCVHSGQCVHCCSTTNYGEFVSRAIG